jgi:SprT protein
LQRHAAQEQVQYLPQVGRPDCCQAVSHLRKSTDLEGALSRFLPQGALELTCEMLRRNPHHLEITPARSTKYGDFSIDHPSGKPRISVNGNLNPYAFLITLMHELAHLLTWQEAGDKVKPHGAEWKQHFRTTLGPFLNLGIFPDDIARAISLYLANPAASTCSDEHLSSVLVRYDRTTHPNVRLLKDIPQHSRFMYGRDRRVFIKGERLRKRYQCRCEATRDIYLFSPITKILVPTPDQNG